MPTPAYNCILPDCTHPSVAHGDAMWAAFDRIGIPPRYYTFTIESYPGTIPPQLDLEREDHWIKRYAYEGAPEGLLLQGEAGRGKSGLVAGLLRHLVHAEAGRAWEDEYSFDEEIRWVNVAQLLIQEKRAFRTPREPIDEAASRDLLILDDLGLGYAETVWAAGSISRLISYRYDCHLPTVITTNLKLTDIADAYGKPVLSRLAQMCEIVHVEGPDLRLPQPGAVRRCQE